MVIIVAIGVRTLIEGGMSRFGAVVAALIGALTDALLEWA